MSEVRSHLKIIQIGLLLQQDLLVFIDPPKSSFSDKLSFVGWGKQIRGFGWAVSFSLHISHIIGSL